MKYSYMLHKSSKGKAHVPYSGHDFFIDSNEIILNFRNQYGERFVFCPKILIRGLITIACLGGIIIGVFIGKLF